MNCHCGVKPASFTIVLQTLLVIATLAASSAGVLAAAVMPSSASVSMNFRDWTTSTMAAL